MALIDDLKKEVWDIYVESWDVQRAQVVPGPDDLRLTNHAKEFDGVTVLYADLDGSTSMVDNYGWQLCAEVYKAYLRCAARIVNDEGGTITAYDGDRIMAVFIGTAKNTSAVRAALKLNYVVREVLNPLFARLYKHLAFPIRHSVGIDTSEMRAARIGVRGSNDLVWVGRAANHAAKMAAIDGQPIWIAGEVYGNMHESVKFDKNGVDVWEAYTWNPMNKRLIYGTSGWYVF
jgi:class 3 adenylate cyclase